MDERPKTNPYSVTTGEEARERIEKILRQTQVGVLGLSNGDIPYVVPMNHLYLPGRLSFHDPIVTRKKMEMIKKNPVKCYTVMVPISELKPDVPSCHVKYESVICDRRIKNVDSVKKQMKLINQ